MIYDVQAVVTRPDGGQQGVSGQIDADSPEEARDRAVVDLAATFGGSVRVMRVQPLRCSHCGRLASESHDYPHGWSGLSPNPEGTLLPKNYQH